MSVVRAVWARVRSLWAMLVSILDGIVGSALPLLKALSFDVVASLWSWLKGSPKFDRASIEAELRAAFLAALQSERPELLQWIKSEAPHELPPAVWAALVDVVAKYL